MGGVLKLFWGRGQGLLVLTLYGVLGTLLATAGVSLSGVLEAVYKDAQELLEVNSLSILDLVGSNQFMSSPQWLSFFLKVVA